MPRILKRQKPLQAGKSALPYGLVCLACSQRRVFQVQDGGRAVMVRFEQITPETMPHVASLSTQTRSVDEETRTMTPLQIPTLPQTFRTVVTGPQNALAYNAALHVAKTPGTMYNPLYLSGGPGLGKTHLLRAIQAYLTPRLNGVLYVVPGVLVQRKAKALRELVRAGGGVQRKRRRGIRSGVDHAQRW
jgi:chromosomal replication initiation ATPase DnaA